MVDWDDDSTQLRNNLKQVLRALREKARQRDDISIEDAKQWHAGVMYKLTPPEPGVVGRFRGEAGLEEYGVSIGGVAGTLPLKVAGELAKFQTRLQQAITYLDGIIPPGRLPKVDTLDSVVDLCGWAHAEWVRIHPFANGNGRTARLWANMIAMRYGLPPFIQLRPRPEGDRYADAGAKAMAGEWLHTAALFRIMLDEYLQEKA